MLILGTYKYVPYLAKGTLQMWLKTSRWEVYAGFFETAQCNYKVSYKGEVEGQSRGTSIDVKMKEWAIEASGNWKS